MSQKPYAIDFDGVLVQHPPNIPFKEVLTYAPNYMTAKILHYLVGHGFKFYVLTARPKREHKLIRKWLKCHNFPLMPVTNIKRNATLYIDDRAYRFTNWLDIGKLLR